MPRCNAGVAPRNTPSTMSKPECKHTSSPRYTSSPRCCPPAHPATSAIGMRLIKRLIFQTSVSIYLSGLCSSVRLELTIFKHLLLRPRLHDQGRPNNATCAQKATEEEGEESARSERERERERRTAEEKLTLHRVRNDGLFTPCLPLRWCETGGEYRPRPREITWGRARPGLH